MILYSDYMIVEASSHTALTELVKVFMQKGWQPIGGVSTANLPSFGVRWYQAIGKPIVNN